MKMGGGASGQCWHEHKYELKKATQKQVDAIQAISDSMRCGLGVEIQIEPGAKGKTILQAQTVASADPG